MIERRKREAYQSECGLILKEIEDDCGTLTPEVVVNYLLSDPDWGWGGRGSWAIVKYYDNDGRTLRNRLHMLWVIPLLTLSLPFQWLFTGSTGLTRNSKVGKLVDKLIKF